MIFIDSNVPMYLVGADHTNKQIARRLVELSVARQERLVTDVEVLQEILQRYVAIDRREAIQPAFDAILGVVDEVLPIELADAQRARAMVLGPGALSARDALHIAVMERHGIERVLTFDSAFDRIPGIRRVVD